MEYTASNSRLQKYFFKVAINFLVMTEKQLLLLLNSDSKVCHNSKKIEF